MRKHFLSAMALVAISVAQAQPSISITGGIHQSSVSPRINDQPNAISSVENKRTGPHFGFIANIPFSTRSRFYFQPGVIFSAKGSKSVLEMDSAKTTIRTATITRNLNYIDIPLNLVYKLPLSPAVRFVIGGGPQASLFYNGNVQTATTDYTGQYGLQDNNDLPVGNQEGQYRILHMAANALAGFEVGRMSLLVNYSKGITDFYRQNNNSYKHATIGASLGIKLGKGPAHVKPIIDTDKDGMPDEQDTCPTLPGTALTKGCPDKDGDGIADKQDHCPDVAGVKENKGCPITDTDGDGINDNDDQCITIAGVAKYHGCPIPDTDKDGINDEEDKCPTVAGVKENNGCPVVKAEPVAPVASEKVNAASHLIQFEFKKATLTSSSYQVLDEVAALLTKEPQLTITIEGHSSSEGQAAYNVKLSEERAASVKKYLVRKGIAAQRITTIGYGSAKPLVAEKTEADRAKNRRVVLILNN